MTFIYQHFLCIFCWTNTFADIITRDKGENPNSEFKQEVVRVLGESEKSKLNNVLHGLSLGDLKPSQLLAKFKLNAGTSFTENIIRQMWLIWLVYQRKCKWY